MTDDDLRQSYDRVADEYVARLFNELDDKPFDRDLLDRFARRVRMLGPVLDVGCGPGHVSRYLGERGVEVAGVDLSPAMIEKARKLTPESTFIEADMRRLALPEQSLVGMVAFYSIVHLPEVELAPLFTGWRRFLQPGAPLLLAFHLGQQPVQLDEWWNQPVNLEFHFFSTEQVKAALVEAGWQVTAAVEREPYPEPVEHQSRRGYVLAEA